jgi:hypothetical protein
VALRPRLWPGVPLSRDGGNLDRARYRGRQEWSGIVNSGKWPENPRPSSTPSGRLTGNTAGLPAEAIIPRREVPDLPRGRLMTFEARWRAVTMARLYSRCGWTYKQIGSHFGVGLERARQLVRLTGYRGKRRRGG